MYDQVISMIIRPPRVPYRPEQLGPKLFQIASERFARTDFVAHRRRTPDDKRAPASAAAPAASSSSSSSDAPAAAAASSSSRKKKGEEESDDKLNIECSFFGPAQLTKATAVNVVIYCHGNSGAIVQFR